MVYQQRKGAPDTGAPAAAEIETIVSELSRAEDAVAVRAVLARVTGLVLAGKVAPRVGATVSQLAAQTLKAIAQDHSAAMKELHKLLDQHAAEQVRGWSRRRQNRPGGQR